MIAQSHILFEGLDIISTQEIGPQSYEVCATCKAAFINDTPKMVVELNAFVRRFEIRGKDEICLPPWLPTPETVRMGVEPEEARDAAKEVFASWVKRIRRVIPPGSEWASHPEWLRPARETNA